MMNPLRKKVLDYTKRPVLKEMAASAVGAGIARSFGSLIPIVIAWFFGIGGDTDLFFFAFAIIMFMTSVLSITMETVSIPFFASIKSDGDDIGAFVGVLFFIILLATSLLAVFLYVAIQPILFWLTHFSLQQVEEIRTLIFFILPVFTFVVCSSIFVGSLNAQSIYFVPSLSTALRSAVVVIAIYFGSKRYGIIALSAAYVIGEGFRFLLLYWYIVIKKLYVIKMTKSILPQVKHFFNKGSYHIASALLGGINPLIDKSVALWIGLGSISVIEYADRLNGLPLMFFSSLLPVLLSRWSNAYYSNSMIDLREKVATTIKYFTIPIVIINIVVLFFSEYIVRLVYLHGDFPADKVLLVSQTFSAYMIGLWPYLVAQTIIRGYMAMKITKILMILAIARVFMNIIFDIIFAKLFGVFGIALSATLCTSILTAVLAYRYFRKDDFAETKNAGVRDV